MYFNSENMASRLKVKENKCNFFLNFFLTVFELTSTADQRQALWKSKGHN